MGVEESAAGEISRRAYRLRRRRLRLVIMTLVAIVVVALGTMLSVHIVNANKPVLKGIGQAEQMTWSTFTYTSNGGFFAIPGDSQRTQFIVAVSPEQFSDVLTILDANKPNGIVFAVPADYRQVEPLLTQEQRQQIAAAPSPHTFLVTTTQNYFCVGLCPELK